MLCCVIRASVFLAVKKYDQRTLKMLRLIKDLQQVKSWLDLSSKPANVSRVAHAAAAAAQHGTAESHCHGPLSVQLVAEKRQPLCKEFEPLG
jgi:dTDP-4-dehydrorhamnose reductase